MRFSANLGFLWTELPLAEGIRAAATHGFAAVECHFPYDQPLADVQRALEETGLPMLGLNTRKGDGLGGLAALIDRVGEARAAIDEAISYGQAIGAQNVHVMAGMAEGHRAKATFEDNLKYATERAELANMQVVIEPLNAHDAPNYFLNNILQAVDIIDSLSLENLRLMFDCYHVGRTEGDVITQFDFVKPLIGHVQFAGVPDRGRPDQGTVDYREVFAHIKAQDWDAPLGAEYRPLGSTEDSLGWMNTLC